MIIEFEIGDQSGDGHSQSETYIYNCIHPRCHIERVSVMQAYKSGCSKLGFDLVEDCCCDYEERSISKGHMDKLVSFGFTHEDMDEMTDFMNSEWWIEIYVFICKLGNPEISFTEVRNQHVNIGGYGLFN